MNDPLDSMAQASIGGALQPHNRTEIGAVIVMILLALAILGPREAMRSRWLAAGATLAVLGALPYGLWQLAHGLPQSALARSIAHSGAEGGRVGFVPFQLILIGPLLAPVWISGLVKLLRDPALRALQCFAAAYLILIPVFILAGGKAYYMAGLYPILLAGGALSVERWLRTNPGRAVLVSTAVALTAVASALIGLDVLPVRDLRGSVVIALNPDAGETVGWPRLTETVAAVYRSLPATTRSRTAIFTHTYGEARRDRALRTLARAPLPLQRPQRVGALGPPAQHRHHRTAGRDRSSAG